VSPGENLCPLSEEYLHGDNCFQRNPINRVLSFVEERSSLKSLCFGLKGDLTGLITPMAELIVMASNA